jgi:hypothetical protein
MLGQKRVKPRAISAPNQPNFAAARCLEIIFFAMSQW